MKKRTELPPDWFCQGQQSLLDLLTPQCEHCLAARDTCDVCSKEKDAR
jgi:hypothetical protein